MTRLLRTLLRKSPRSAPKTARTLIRPSFLFIGAQKAGTTACHKYLQLHPQIVAPATKELDFFSCNGRYKRGTDYYHSNFVFDNPPADATAFESSPDYLVVAHTAARIRDYNPAMRLLCILRDPVDRAFSAWNMYRRLTARNRNFSTEWMRRCDPDFDAAQLVPRTPEALTDFHSAIKQELALLERGESVELPLLNHGLYAEQLAHYRQQFEPQQLLVLERNELLRRTGTVLAVIARFVGVAAIDWDLHPLRPLHQGSYVAALDKRSEALLRAFYFEPNRRLFSSLGCDFDWK